MCGDSGVKSSLLRLLSLIFCTMRRLSRDDKMSRQHVSRRHAGAQTGAAQTSFKTTSTDPFQCMTAGVDAQCVSMELEGNNTSSWSVIHSLHRDARRGFAFAPLMSSHSHTSYLGFTFRLAYMMLLVRACFVPAPRFTGSRSASCIECNPCSGTS